MDEATVAFVGAPGRGGGPGDRAEEFAFFRGFAAALFAGFGLAVEGLGDSGTGALLAQGQDFDVEFAAFVFDVQHVTDADLPGRFGGLAVGEDALQFAGLRGLLAGLEESGGPEPFIDAGSCHAGIVVDFLDAELDGAEHAAGEGEKRADQFERAADHEADETEREQDQPDEREEDYRCQGQRPAKEGEKTEEKEVEHRCCSSPEIF